MKGRQEEIDKLSALITENAKWSSATRYFASPSSGINNEDFCDLAKKIVTVGGSFEPGKSLMKIESNPISDIYVSILNNIVAELKETSGNRDFNQGGTANGVVAASAISAIQESGSKGSRDANRAAYRAYAKINKMVISLCLQFYTITRSFRITMPNGQYNFREVNLSEVSGGRDIDFDIKVRPYKQSPFSSAAQNERAMLYSRADSLTRSFTTRLCRAWR